MHGLVYLQSYCLDADVICADFRTNKSTKSEYFKFFQKFSFLLDTVILAVNVSGMPSDNAFCIQT